MAERVGFETLPFDKTRSRGAPLRPLRTLPAGELHLTVFALRRPENPPLQRFKSVTNRLNQPN